MNNDNNNNLKGKKNEIFTKKVILFIKRFIMRYKYQLFVKLKIKKELEILIKKYEDLMEKKNIQN